MTGPGVLWETVQQTPPPGKWRHGKVHYDLGEKNNFKIQN